MAALIKTAWIVFFAGIILSCSLTSSAPPAATAMRTMEILNTAAAPPSATPAGTLYELNHVRFIIPAGLVAGAGSTVSTDVEYPYINGDDPMAEHTVITLNGYALPGMPIKPRLMVFNADEFSQYGPVNEKIITGLNALQSHPDPSADRDIAGDFFAQWKTLASDRGFGVRYLPQIRTGYAPIDNEDLFYCYMGLSQDGKHYIEATFNVQAAFLVSNGQATGVPAGGVPFPSDSSDAVQAMPAYFSAIKTKLDQTPPDGFSPSLMRLDDFILSIEIVP